MNKKQVLNIGGIEIKVDGEEIIKSIAKKCFTEECWNIDELPIGWKELVVGREKVNREDFIDSIVGAFINERVINLTYDEWHRGIGKSYFINEVSKIFKIPVISKKCYSRRDCFAMYTVDEVIGMNIKEVLVDENISMDDIHKLKNNGFKVFGFITTYGRYDLI